MLPSRRLLGIALALATLAVGGQSHAEPVDRGPAEVAASRARGTTVTFPYHQRRLLYSRNGSGGLAHVTSGAARGAALPVVVVLHGMNAEGQMHMWFGPPYGDLRSVVEPLVASGAVTPFILAAPTHTRFATGAGVMWPHFELADFLEATERALDGRAHVDRARVIVVGHSAAGCNVAGGILGEGVRGAGPLAVLAVDTCLDRRVLPALAAVAAKTRVRFFWQRTWPRPIEELARVCASCEVVEIVDPAPSRPHAAIVPEALRRALPELLPGR